MKHLFAVVLFAVLLPGSAIASVIRVGVSCTLANAIASANGNASVGGCTAGQDGAVATDVITVPVGTHRINDLAVTDSVEIAGAGAGSTILDGDTTVDGTGDHRLLDLSAGITAIIRDVTFNRGRPPDAAPGDNASAGGAILSSAALTLVRVTLSNNSAGRGGDAIGIGSDGVGGGHGGAIAAPAGALSLIDCVVFGNRSGAGGDGGGGPGDNAGVSGDGGAIWAGSGVPVTIEASIFIDDATAFGPARGRGGAVNVSSATLDVTATNFQGNSGGVGIVYALNTTVHVDASSFVGNTVVNGGASLYGSSARLTVRNTTVRGTTGGAGIGLTTALFSSAKISHSTIIANDTGVSVNNNTTGGSAMTVTNSIVAGNTVNCTVSGSNSVLLTPGPSFLGADCPGSSQTHVVAAADVFTQLVATQGIAAGTIVYPLLPASPALDAADCFDVDGEHVAVDQRGVPRPYVLCDAGAYEAGPLGTTGPTGGDGATGPTGPDGANGVDGASGPTGATGADGATGGDGTPSASGSQGQKGDRGEDGPPGPTGAQGQPGIDRVARQSQCASGDPSAAWTLLAALAIVLLRRRR